MVGGPTGWVLPAVRLDLVGAPPPKSQHPAGIRGFLMDKGAGYTTPWAAESMGGHGGGVDGQLGAGLGG